MINKKRRTGFTIVELVIVIAVIAILAAVLIPTFSNIVKKAETAADIQTVKNLNTIVATESATKGQIKTAHDAIVAASENGYNLEYITPTADGRTIAWDGTNYQFVLLDDENEVIFPDDDKPATPIANLFIISDTYPATNYDGFAVYLTDDFGETSIEVTTGLDVGYNSDIVAVTYNGTSEVTIRTNSELCNFVMNSGIVNHYGVALKATVNTTEENYHCYAELMDPTIYGNGVEPTTLFAGGQGTEESPFLISTNENFNNIGNEELQTKMKNGEAVYFKLIDDITVNEQYDFLSGVLDGNGKDLTLSVGDTGAQYFFASAMGETTVKNLNIVQDKEYITAFVYGANLNPWTGHSYEGTITFENVTAKSNGNIEHKAKYGASSFVYVGYEQVKFINCVNEISFNVIDRGTSVFLGNSQYVSKAYFEKCINKGDIIGPHVSFFKNNPNGIVTIVTNDLQVYNENANSWYIKDCANEGLMMGFASSKPFGSMNYVIEHVDAANAALTSDMFSAGLMITSSGKVGLELSDGKLNIIDETNNNAIYEYEITYNFFTSHNVGSSYLLYTEIVKIDDVDKSVDYVISAMTSSDWDQSADENNKYEKLAESGELEDINGHKFVLVEVEGGKMLVVNDKDLPSMYSSTQVEDGEEIKFTIDSKAKYTIYAKTASGVVDGNSYYKGDLE